MNAHQIAGLIGLTTQGYINWQLDSKETADIANALFKLAEERGIHKETCDALREFNLRNYEAPVVG